MVAAAVTVERAAQNELQALERLKASIADALADDPDLLLDMAEGSTSVLEIIDKLLEADLIDAGLLDGLDTAAQIVEFRQARFKQRIKTRRAILEQALMLLERKKLERPTATISLTERGPKVEVVNEGVIPSRFFSNKPVLNKKGLDAAVAAGEEVPGVRMTNGSASLTVRRK